MNNYEATFTEITSWQKNIHYSTGGTRSKYIALHPENNEEYFFKGSKETPNGEIRYPTEFWSEIVSSKIGHFLKFEMLDYNIAYDKNHNQKIGCLSKSMILHSENKLTEGVQYLTGFNSNYNPEKDKKLYTFQFIKEALKDYNLEKYLENIIEIIIFDSIIGNSDRHQENWSIITKHKITIESNKSEVKFFKKEESNFFKKIRKFGESFFSDKNTEFEKILDDPNFKVKFETTHRFAPIYDSGCCLGREHEESKVDKMIVDSQMIESYIRKGESEIHWEGLEKKSKHFELVTLLLQNYPNQTKRIILRVKDNFDKNKIKEIIDNIDCKLPEELINYKLSNSRKELMYKLITLRIEKLVELI